MAKIFPRLVGKRIFTIRKEKRLTQKEFGELLGDIDRSLISKWEQGKNLPNRERLEKIAKLGDISVDYLLYGSLEEFAYSILIDDVDNHGKFFNCFKEKFSKLSNIDQSDVTVDEALNFIINNKKKLTSVGVKSYAIARANFNLNNTNKIELYDSDRMLSSLIFALNSILDLPLEFKEYYDDYLNAAKLPYHYTSRSIDKIKSDLLKKGRTEKEATEEAYERFYISKLSKHLKDFKKGIKEVKEEYDKNK